MLWYVPPRLERRHKLSLLITYLGPQRTRVLLLAALLLGSIGLQIVNPQVVQSFIDQTQSGINDVHSGSQQTGSDGTAYNTW